jgi:hypothetical protein
MIIGLAGGVGYVAVPAAVALETIGVPVPAETTLVAAAVLASEGRLTIAIVILLAASAAIVGDNVGYLLGRRLGRRVLLAPGPFAAHRPRVVEGGDRFFAAHGAAAVFLGRWVVVAASPPPGSRAPTGCRGAGSRSGTPPAASPGRRASGSSRIHSARPARAAGRRRGGRGHRHARPADRPDSTATAPALPPLATRQVVAILGLGAAATAFALFVLPEIAGA